MSNLTEEQTLAVNKKGTNIIVSAGAGSGKTTVLKTRVLRELEEDNVSLSNLIILTFTKNAAAEMKERIRKIILESDTVSEQSELVDTANITTFDSYANTLVKKYNYLLNIDKDFKIIDASIIRLEIERVINDIFEELYQKDDRNFTKMIKDLCVKDDKDIRDAIIDIYYKITSIIDRDKFLDTYIDNFFNDNKINSLYESYSDFIFKIRDDILNLIDELNDETINSEKLSLNEVATNNFRYATSPDELALEIDFKLADARGNVYTDEGKVIKKKIDVLKDRLKDYLVDTKKDAISKYLSTKDYATSIIYILKEIDKRIMDFKHTNNAYEFNDIALLAIDLVKNNSSVREEIKQSTYEIMIDEYQDTNDIQEEFIKYIENNNVYMVGDVKQSIYRFRNANPYIFKTKYDNYKNGINGFKIDLNKNFRSRSEVVNNINLIFNNIMTNDVGGAKYKEEHKMEFGNTKYDKNIVNNNYDMEILTYDHDDAHKDEEVEIFAMANDILKRINSHEQVTYMKKDEMLTRDAKWEDFVVLVDKGRNFELIKKIFEYKGIPTTIDKDISIKEEDEIFILKNLISLIVSIKNDTIDVDFKHSFLSIARSYIYKLSDNEIFNIFNNNSFKDTDIYKKCLNISLKIDALSNRDILNLLLEEFDIVNKLNLVGDIEERLTKLEYFINTSNDLNNAGFDIYSLNDYFNNILTGKEDIKMSAKQSSGNSVTIMTIHGSKGLEYTYVYLPFLDSDFTRSGKKSKFYFTRNTGLILPFFDEGYGNTFIYTLYKDTEYLEALSEKVRLFYVALTRAKEKIIMILKNNEKIEAVNDVTYSDLTTIKKFSDMINLIKNKLSKYMIPINVDNLNISQDYNSVKSYDYKKHIMKVKEKISVTPLNIEAKVLENKHFSKALTSVVTKELKSILDYGTRMHYIFEVYDFKNNKINNYTLSEEEQNCVNSFLQSDITKNIKDAKILKEHEIMYNLDGKMFHGFIDLLLEYDDHFDIIDYKLSNINNPLYVNQLNGYRDYIISKYNKPVNMYLYSIKQCKFKKVPELEK